MTTPDDISEVRTPPADSIFGDLAGRREKIASTMTTVLPVPRWTEPEIYVRYKVIPHEDISKALRSIDNAKGKDRGTAEILANCDILIQACAEVFGKLGTETYSLDPESPRGDKTKFDDRLAVNLGLNSQSTARQVVRKLFFTDGDILTTAGTYMDWVGYKRDMIEEEIEGES